MNCIAYILEREKVSVSQWMGQDAGVLILVFLDKGASLSS